MERSLILGGTRGFGFQIAYESVRRSVPPVIVGRTAEVGILNKTEAREDAAVFIAADITRPDSMLLMFSKIPVTDIRYIFWVAGIFEQKPLGAMTFGEIESMVATHLSGPLKFFAQFRRLKDTTRSLSDDPYCTNWKEPHGGPIHLVVIGSVSSWRLRKKQSVYCAMTAAKAAFARNFAEELHEAYPGSKITLINPGGMKTTFFDDVDDPPDISRFMNPAAVAHIVWDEVLRQEGLFEEVQIDRNEDGQPVVSYGPRLPQIP